MSVNRRDKRRERYSRNTEGWNAQGFFSPDPEVAYGTSATINDLIYLGAAGEIGIYDETGAIVTATPADGVKWFFAQKNSDETIKKSTEVITGQFSVRKTAYDAPVQQKDIISPLNINIVGGLQEFVLSVRETTPANQPFPIQEGRAIVRSGTPTDYDIANQIVADINNSYDYERNGDNAFVSVNVITDILGTAGTLGTSVVLTDGSNQMYISGADATAEAAPGAYVIVNAFSPEPGTVFQIVDSFYDGTNTYATLDRAYSNSEPGGVVFTVPASLGYTDQATLDASTIGIEVVGKDELVHFTTSVSEDLGDAVITTTQDWNFGSGAAWQVASIEDECAVFDGWTTLNEAWVRDFGAPDLWVDDSADTQYALYFFETLNRIIPSAGAPQNQTLMQANIVVAAIEGSTLETNLDTIFGTTP